MYPELNVLLDDGLKDIFTSQESPAELYDPQRYILSLGGKRLRPLLTLIACDLFDADVKKALPAAISIELFHNFSLIHDDILDNAPLRRGRKTVHEKWSSNIAILSGDALLVKAYQMLAQSDKAHLKAMLDVFNSTAIEVCEGQQQDMNFETRVHVGVNDYLDMIARKTAALIACSMKMGGIAADQKDIVTQQLYLCGRHCGIAFQLMDDFLDVYGDSSLVGKQNSGDIISNKKTYLLLTALSQSNAAQLRELEFWLTKKEFVAEDKINAVKNIFDQLNIRSAAKAEMKRHADAAFDCLKQVSASEKKKEKLSDFLYSFIDRKS